MHMLNESNLNIRHPMNEPELTHARAGFYDIRHTPAIFPPSPIYPLSDRRLHPVITTRSRGVRKDGPVKRWRRICSFIVFSSWLGDHRNLASPRFFLLRDDATTSRSVIQTC